MYYEDVFRLTLCPHRTFPANDGKNNFASHSEAYLSRFYPEGVDPNTVRQTL